MGDTDQAAAAEPSAASRQIRVFLSSTFRDFMQERDLLVKQVFPSLRRKAQERGVEVVDVDLRWGITEEESRQGKVIPICLGEIDRCRPYFVGMLGERYGWIPPSDQYSPDVIERQPWLNDHLGGVSVTELEILHGVLNDPSMAGRAFFYFRDPAWSVSQGEPGFVCETQEEEAKLADLKQRVRTSGFPVAENIPDPKALADQIGSDLWELIEQQYPDRDEPDALEREKRQHASYQHSRLGIYLGGKRSINQLERRIDAGQQKILITGESGSGKSALIANWIETHKQNHPEDVVFAHHLGCTNDASAIRPLLARLIETAKQQLPEVYGYSLSVPQDWWELVAKAIEALQSLGRWAQQNNHRWIWVLDGLDRLAPDDQKALPWLPLTIPDGVVFMASALECPAREILLQRKYKTHTIAPLKAKDQDALIKQYLGRYTKQLIAELRQTILIHPLAGSPLFLRVLLEELRQCGRYETLADQLTGYLSAKTIDDLYERVLERLEADTSAENVRKVMTALWASRAGLSEEELLSFTGLPQLQWAPIDIALEQALGRNDNRLLIDHDYLRKGVEDRYLPTKEEVRKAHSQLADWFDAQEEWNERKAAEWPWQLRKYGNWGKIESLLSSYGCLTAILKHAGAMELASLLLHFEPHERLRISKELMRHLSNSSLMNEEQHKDGVSVFDLLDECGLYGEYLARIAQHLVKVVSTNNTFSSSQKVAAYIRYGLAEYRLKNLRQASDAYSKAVDLAREGGAGCSLGTALNGIGLCMEAKGDYLEAIKYYEDAVSIFKNENGEGHPYTLTAMHNLAKLKLVLGRDSEAITDLANVLDKRRLLLGERHSHSAISMISLAECFIESCDYSRAEAIVEQAGSIITSIFEGIHPYGICCRNVLGSIRFRQGLYSEAASMYEQSLQDCLNLLGLSHSLTISTSNSLKRVKVAQDLEIAEHAKSNDDMDEYIVSDITPESLLGMSLDALVALKKGLKDEAIGTFLKCLNLCESKLGDNVPQTLDVVNNLAEAYRECEEWEISRRLYERCYEHFVSRFGEDHSRSLSILNNLGYIALMQNEPDKAVKLLSAVRVKYERYLDPGASKTQQVTSNLASALLESGDCEAARVLLSEYIETLERLCNPQSETFYSLKFKLAESCSALGDFETSVLLRREELHWLEKTGREDSADHCRSLLALAEDLMYSSQLNEAEELARRAISISDKEEVLDGDEAITAITLLTRILVQRGRYSEAITSQRNVLNWLQEHNGSTDPETLESANELAISLRETGELKEANALFRELLSARQQVLEPSDFDIGRALGGLAKTLEEAGNLDEAVDFAEQALVHRFKHEGADAWWTNRERLDLAGILHKLRRSDEALSLIDQLQGSMAKLKKPDDDDKKLLAKATELRRSIVADGRRS